jgi:hypothetical protein
VQKDSVVFYPTPPSLVPFSPNHDVSILYLLPDPDTSHTLSPPRVHPRTRLLCPILISLSSPSSPRPLSPWFCFTLHVPPLPSPIRSTSSTSYFSSYINLERFATNMVETRKHLVNPLVYKIIELALILTHHHYYLGIFLCLLNLDNIF